MKTDYNKLFEQITESFGNEKKRLLLHACCAPCSTSVLERLQNFFDVTVFFFNPNIDTEKEYYLRANELDKLKHYFAIDKIIVPDYNSDLFLKSINGLENEKEGGARCNKCFDFRLDQTAQTAKQDGFDFFATTLTVSPHKNSILVNTAGLEAATKTGAEFLPSDFKKREGYKRSIELSKQFDLYRQCYCGCVFSKI